MFSQAAKLLDIVKNKQSTSKTKVIAVASGKGGVGKSTIVANLGYSLMKLNKKIALVDADFGLANLHLHFDLRPQNFISDYINSQKSISEIKIKLENGLDIYPGKSGIEALEQTSIFVFIQMLEELKAKNIYDFILIDCGAGMDDNLQEILKNVDSLIGVTLRDPSALTDIYAFMKLSSRFLDQINLIYNQTQSLEQAIAITGQLDKLVQQNVVNKNFVLNILGIISENKSVANSARLKKLVVKEFAISTTAKEFNKISQAIIRGK